jgi:hypothetical protein
MKLFTITPARTALVAATTAAMLGSMLVAGPANAAESRVTNEEAAAIRTAMTNAGVSESTQEALITKLQSGQQSDSERPDAQPVSVDESALPSGGTSRVATYADGSQRTTSEVPITTAGAAGPITTLTTIECNLIHCTVLWSKAQTKTMASGSAAAGALITALCRPAAWACAIAIGLMVDTANRAVSQGKCAGIRRFVTAAPVWPIIEPCRQ